MASVNMTAVNEIIDKYVGDTLDTYVLITAKEAAKAKAESGGSPVEIANAVYDILYEKFSGDAVIAVASQQICPKYILPIMRNDIIAALGKK